MDNIKYDKYNFRKDICQLKLNYTKDMTDSLIWVNIAYEALSKTNPEKIAYELNKKIKYRKDFTEELNRAKTIELYYSSFVYIYSKLEDYFVKVFEIINKYIPNSVSDKVINNFVNMDKNRQKDFLNNELKLDFSDSRMEMYYYLRNIRNIIVHNNGHINKKFMENTEYKYDYNIGQKIHLDKEFEKVIKEMKGIIGAFTHSICTKYNLPNSEEYNKHIGKTFTRSDLND